MEIHWIFTLIRPPLLYGLLLALSTPKLCSDDNQKGFLTKGEAVRMWCETSKMLAQSGNQQQPSHNKLICMPPLSPSLSWICVGPLTGIKCEHWHKKGQCAEHSTDRIKRPEPPSTVQSVPQDIRLHENSYMKCLYMSYYVSILLPRISLLQKSDAMTLRVLKSKCLIIFTAMQFVS